MEILSPIANKLRAVAKNSFKNCQNEQKNFWGFFSWKKTADLQEFKFLSTKVCMPEKRDQFKVMLNNLVYTATHDISFIRYLCRTYSK